MAKAFLQMICFLMFVRLWTDGLVQPSKNVSETVNIGVVYDSKSQSTLKWKQEQVLQTTINRLKAETKLLKSINFVFHYVYESNLTSIRHCLKLLCENLLPRNVQAIIVTLDDCESELLSRWASLVDLDVLGTARSITLSNKVSDSIFLTPKKITSKIGNSVFLSSD
jgi:hypothetical protein